jgi:hypothetical protein
VNRHSAAGFSHLRIFAADLAYEIKEANMPKVHMPVEVLTDERLRLPLEPVPVAEKFTLSLDYFEIKTTRSLYQDTDYVTFTLLVKSQDGTGTPQTLKKAMGDVNDGIHAVNLSFQNVEIGPTDTVVLNYLIVNSGHKSPGEIESTLENAAITLATKGGTVLGNDILPGLGSLLGPLAGWLAKELIGVLAADCDGPVAAEQDTFTYADLIAKTPAGTFHQSTTHDGSDSPAGCGRNSLYVVNWSMFDMGKVKAVPYVIGFPASEAAKIVHEAGFVAKFTGQNGTRSWVGNQSPAPGELMAPGSIVHLALRTGVMP